MDIFDLTGNKIKEFRDQAGLTREKLSEVSGIPISTIQDIESGITKNPGIETIKPLLVALGANNKSKMELVFLIVSELTALNDEQLEAIIGVIRGFNSSSALAMKKK